jgi:serine/threonine protein kinase
MALQSVESLGPYRVVRFLGAGGMGSVYEVEHLVMGTRHAMKVLGDQYRHSAAVRERFRREAQLMFQLGAHSHIVRATDLVEEGEALGLVIDLIDGGDLGEALDARPGPLPWDEAWAILKPVVSAVAFAHASKVVHRDLKPENVLLRKGPTWPGVPVVADFGIAKVLGSESATRTQARMGTAGYGAPEQLKNAKEVGPEADVWALGMLTYRLVTGELPVDPEDNMALIKLYEGMTPAPRLTGVPDAVAHAVAAALNPDPGQRPRDAGVFGKLLVAEATDWVPALSESGAPGPASTAAAPPPSGPPPIAVANGKLRIQLLRDALLNTERFAEEGEAISFALDASSGKRVTVHPRGSVPEDALLQAEEGGWRVRLEDGVEGTLSKGAATYPIDTLLPPRGHASVSHGAATSIRIGRGDYTGGSFRFPGSPRWEIRVALPDATEDAVRPEPETKRRWGFGKAVVVALAFFGLRLCVNAAIDDQRRSDFSDHFRVVKEQKVARARELAEAVAPVSWVDCSPLNVADRSCNVHFVGSSEGFGVKEESLGNGTVKLTWVEVPMRCDTLEREVLKGLQTEYPRATVGCCNSVTDSERSQYVVRISRTHPWRCTARAEPSALLQVINIRIRGDEVFFELE